MKKTLEEYIKNTLDAEFDDEKVNSDILSVTLVKSLRGMESLKNTKDYEKYKVKNQWLYEICNKIEKVPILSFDQLKNQINRDYRSCDGFFYNTTKDSNIYSLLVEFKDVSRKDILEYIKSEKEDSIYLKVKDTIRMIENDIDFEEGFSGRELSNVTHFVIVYGDKANTITPVSLGFGRRTSDVPKDKNGRQKQAISLKSNQRKVFSKKEEQEIMRVFGEKLQGLGLRACPKGYFGIPVSDPDMVKKKGIGNLFYFTMFTKYDFAKLVEEKEYFDSWNWGKYAVYFKC